MPLPPGKRRTRDSSLLPSQKKKLELHPHVLRIAALERIVGLISAENLLAKSRSFRCYFVALGDVVALGLGEVSRHPLGEASKRLVAQVAFDSTPGVLRRRLCGRHQQHESGPTLETIGLAADVEAHAVLVSAAVLLVCCCVPGLLLCAVCCAVLCHF